MFTVSDKAKRRSRESKEDQVRKITERIAQEKNEEETARISRWLGACASNVGAYRLLQIADPDGSESFAEFEKALAAANDSPRQDGDAFALAVAEIRLIRKFKARIRFTRAKNLGDEIWQEGMLVLRRLWQIFKGTISGYDKLVKKILLFAECNVVKKDRPRRPKKGRTDADLNSTREPVPKTVLSNWGEHPNCGWELKTDPVDRFLMNLPMTVDVETALDSLRPLEMEVAMRLWMVKHSPAEVADDLGVSLDAVKEAAFCAKRSLKKLLESYDTSR